MSEHYRILTGFLLIYASSGRLMLTLFYSAGSLVLPGEVEEAVTCCTPFFDKPVQPEFRALPVAQPPDSKAQEV